MAIPETTFYEIIELAIVFHIRKNDREQMGKWGVVPRGKNPRFGP
jgi:hypothetical protein